LQHLKNNYCDIRKNPYIEKQEDIHEYTKFNKDFRYNFNHTVSENLNKITFDETLFGDVLYYKGFEE
jgi:hypothetical protein